MIELQDIFEEFVQDYAKKYNPTPAQWRVINDIISCRTAVLGGHIDKCEDCGEIRNSYNSCNNRHCNKCQTMKKEKWLLDRKDELLDIGYFHTVFTIPSELNQLTLQNKKLIYTLLFKASAETVLELASDRKHLNGQVGITSILHTWGQNLNFHPHIHQIIPGGAITSDDKWQKSRDKFLIHVKVLGKKFRGKFLYFLKQEYNNLEFFKDMKMYENPKVFESLIDSLYQKNWIVYSKAPFKNAGSVLEYLGRYTHRIAISNNRILNFKDGCVTFKWKDYKDGSKQKVMRLTGVEFMRRILLHILPDRFMKIRHYGFLANPNKKKRLRLAQLLTGSRLLPKIREKLLVKDIMLALLGIDITKCKACGGNLVRIETARASPNDKN